MIKVPLNFGVKGRFKIEAVKRDGTRRVVADWFDNLILNAGLNRMGTAAIINGCMVGTGTATPAATDTALQAQVAHTTTAPFADSYGADTTENYLRIRKYFRFAEGVAAGNLAEVGVGWASGRCFSRARILDGSGNPTTITILSDESLDVTYELRVYPPTTDVTGTLTLNSINYDYVLRTARLGAADANGFFGFLAPSGMSNWTNTSGTFARTGAGSLGDIYSSAGGTGTVTVGSYTPQTYVNNSYRRTCRLTWGLANGSSSFPLIQFFSPLGYCKASFTPSIPKTGSNILTIDLQVTWARRP